MNTKKIIRLSGTVAPAADGEFRRSATLLHHEFSPGEFVHVGLGATGLQFVFPDEIIAVSLDELMKLARAGRAEKKVNAGK
jgi:hypothetical protein